MRGAETGQHDLAAPVVDPHGMAVKVAMRDADPVKACDAIEKQLRQLDPPLDR